AGRPDRLAALEEARANAEVAREIFALRRKAGLTQRQLATLVGTTSSVISRLEDADYEGHSMAMLRRIAAALNKRVQIRFVPAHFNNAVNPACSKWRSSVSASEMPSRSITTKLMQSVNGQSLSSQFPYNATPASNSSSEGSMTRISWFWRRRPIRSRKACRL